jgi:hypothetical protein
MKMDRKRMNEILKQLQKLSIEDKEKDEMVKVDDALEYIQKEFYKLVLLVENKKMESHQKIKAEMINDRIGELYNNLKLMEWIETDIFKNMKEEL